MEFVAAFALSAIIAILVGWAGPMVTTSTNANIVKLQSSYFGKTFLNTVVIFGAIIVAGLLFSIFNRRVTV
jgi:hypothetical protein